MLILETYNRQGQLGVEEKVARYHQINEPQRVEYFVDEEIQIVAVACGIAHTVFLSKTIHATADDAWSSTSNLLNNGDIFVCGSNEHGQLGLQTNDMPWENIEGEGKIAALPIANAFLPVRISRTSLLQGVVDGAKDDIYGEYDTNAVPEHRDIAHIACGGGHTLVVDSYGYVYCAGLNSSGQLGIGPSVDMDYFVRIPFRQPVLQQGDGSNSEEQGNQESTSEMLVAYVACGEEFSMCIIKGTRDVYAWGLNIAGQLGLGINEADRYKSSPCLVTGMCGKQADTISAGQCQVMVSTSSGQIYSWGLPPVDGIYVSAARPTIDRDANNDIIREPTLLKSSRKSRQLICGRKHYVMSTIDPYGPFSRVTSGFDDEDEDGKVFHLTTTSHTMPLTIQVYDTENQPCTTGGAVLVVTLQKMMSYIDYESYFKGGFESDSKALIAIKNTYKPVGYVLDVDDNNNGTYSVKVRPSYLHVAGLYQLTITINELHIVGSPFEGEIVEEVEEEEKVNDDSSYHHAFMAPIQKEVKDPYAHISAPLCYISKGLFSPNSAVTWGTNEPPEVFFEVPMDNKLHEMEIIPIDSNGDLYLFNDENRSESSESVLIVWQQVWLHKPNTIFSYEIFEEYNDMVSDQKCFSCSVNTPTKAGIYSVDVYIIPSQVVGPVTDSLELLIDESFSKPDHIPHKYRLNNNSYIVRIAPGAIDASHCHAMMAVHAADALDVHGHHHHFNRHNHDNDQGTEHKHTFQSDRRRASAHPLLHSNGDEDRIVVGEDIEYQLICRDAFDNNISDAVEIGCFFNCTLTPLSHELSTRALMNLSSSYFADPCIPLVGKVICTPVKIDFDQYHNACPRTAVVWHLICEASAAVEAKCIFTSIIAAISNVTITMVDDKRKLLDQELLVVPGVASPVYSEVLNAGPALYDSPPEIAIDAPEWVRPSVILQLRDKFGNRLNKVRKPVVDKDDTVDVNADRCTVEAYLAAVVAGADANSDENVEFLDVVPLKNGGFNIATHEALKTMATKLGAVHCSYFLHINLVSQDGKKDSILYSPFLINTPSPSPVKTNVDELVKIVGDEQVEIKSSLEVMCKQWEEKAAERKVQEAIICAKDAEIGALHRTSSISKIKKHPNLIVSLSKSDREEITNKRALDALQKEREKIALEKITHQKKKAVKRTGGGFTIQYSKDI